MCHLVHPIYRAAYRNYAKLRIQLKHLCNAIFLLPSIRRSHMKRSTKTNETAKNQQGSNRVFFFFLFVFTCIVQFIRSNNFPVAALYRSYKFQSRCFHFLKENRGRSYESYQHVATSEHIMPNCAE